MSIPAVSPYRIILALLLLLPFAAQAQAPRYIITFTDKNGSPYSLSNPGEYLSARSLARRQRQHITTDSTDLPVNPAYTDSLLQAGNVSILYTSRWFNQAIIQTSDNAALQKIALMPFVKMSSTSMQRIRSNANAYTDKFSLERNTTPAINNTARTSADTYDYGRGYTQIHLHNGEYLHDKGFSGQGMLIALLDAGFPGANTNPAYETLRQAGGIVNTFNFTTGTANVYGDDIHGAYCLSTMAANLPGTLVGTAPNASYLLYRTEENATEQPIEENNWAAAAERADSAGADVISSSLAYNTFDNSAYDYTYAQMNGRTTLIAEAATIAARKGMVVVNAAGNEGTSSWHYLCTPADADSILAVGAVNADKDPANFSGYGPAADGRIKPDVTAMGVATQLLNANGVSVSGNGTSFATPITAGLVACLWQAFPQVSNVQLMQVIRRCSDHYTTPDNRVGYGIPDYKMAFDTLTKIVAADSIVIVQRLDNHMLRVLPNPFTSELKIYYSTTGNAPVQIALLNSVGQLLRQVTVPATGNNLGVVQWDDLSQLATGLYYIRLIQGSEKANAKIIKL